MVTVARFGAALVLAIASTAFVGALSGLTWLTENRLLIQLGIGVPALVFMVWPASVCLAMVWMGELNALRAFGLSSVVSIGCIPAFVHSTAWFVWHFSGIDLLQRNLGPLLYALSGVGILAGIWALFWNDRFALLSQIGKRPNNTLHADARTSAPLDQPPSARAGERGR